MLDIGAAIREVRGMLELSQREAARGMGISHVHLNNIENGRSYPTTGILEKVFASWGVDVYVYAALLQENTFRLLNMPDSTQARIRAAYRKEAADYCREFVRKTKAAKAVQNGINQRAAAKRKTAPKKSFLAKWEPIIKGTAKKGGDNGSGH